MLMICRGSGPIWHQEIAYEVEASPGMDCPLCEMLVGLHRLEALAKAPLPSTPTHLP